MNHNAHYAAAREAGKPPGYEVVHGYSSFDLVELARLIVEKSDRGALEEIHSQRKVITLQDGRCLLLAEYLSLLKLHEQHRYGNDARSISLSERAYDLTLDKFMNLPVESEQHGPDCRRYFRALLKAVDRSLQQSPTASRLKREARSGALLKGLIARHFKLSKMEAVRESNPFWSRYQWRVNGDSITVWMPVSMSGAERRSWLEDNIPTSLFDHPEWGRLIRDHIEQNLVREHFVPLENLENNQQISHEGTGLPLTEDWGLSLADAVAREKAQNIDKQRRAIRKLGPESLAKLVRQIFLDLDAEEYEQKQIAKRFGLSPSTLSRFAGTDWRQKDTRDQQTPDLWRNTAQVISQIPVFRDVAKEAGMLDRIEAIRGDE